jgi:hypothetical protein
MNGWTAELQRRGFRKWYERELLRSHGHLVLMLLAGIALMGSLEAFFDVRGGDRLLMAACFAVAGVVAVWAMRRYGWHLRRAETVANQAMCPACKDWGRWQAEHPEPAADGRAALRVRCRGCGERWRIVG